MKIILEEQIINEVSRLCIEACTYINKDVLESVVTDFQYNNDINRIEVWISKDLNQSLEEYTS